MRDLQRLEELSSTAAVGLWADDVVLALHRAVGSPPSTEDATLLNDAAAMLEEALHRTDEPVSSRPSARALATTDTTLTAISSLARELPGADERELLSALIGTIRRAARGEASGEDVAPLMSLFGMVSQLQLARSNSVHASRQDARTWTATRLTSNFS